MCCCMRDSGHCLRTAVQLEGSISSKDKQLKQQAEEITALKVGGCSSGWLAAMLLSSRGLSRQFRHTERGVPVCCTLRRHGWQLPSVMQQLPVSLPLSHLSAAEHLQSHWWRRRQGESNMTSLPATLG
jgi:hypothetical protein